MILNDPVSTRTAVAALDGAQTPAPPTVETYSAFGRDYAVLRQSAPMKIGRHHWRLSMLRRKRDSRPFVDAEFRRNDGREHTSRTPCGPLHFDGRLWREAGDWPGKRPPKRIAVLIDATPWARMRPVLHALLDAAERREWVHDARTKWQAPTLLADERHGLPPAYIGYWWIEPNGDGGEADRLCGPFEDRAAMDEAIIEGRHG